MRYRAGPFNVCLQARSADFIRDFALLYADFPLLLPEDSEIIDFHLGLPRPWGVRRWYHPQVRFDADSERPFAPFPLNHAFPHFEWGLNWCIATRANRYLMLHSAVVEKNGRVAILPGRPGSGKSTLCAALMMDGWRLLSDEFGLIRPEDGSMVALPRPIPLKNTAIAAFRAYAPDAVLGPVFPKTRKGDVSHVRPTLQSLQRVEEPGRPAWIVFPQYAADTDNRLYPMARGRAFLRVSGNSFNYELQAAAGFRVVAELARNCESFELHYNHLDPAVEIMNRLAEDNLRIEERTLPESTA